MGKTIFFSTHILSDVREICTRVGILEAGALAACGEISDLLKQSQVRRSVQIAVLERTAEAVEILETFQGVKQIEPVSIDYDGSLQRLKIQFEGDERLLSSLLAELIRQEIPVVHFSEAERDLEDVFLMATKGVVS